MKAAKKPKREVVDFDRWYDTDFGVAVVKAATTVLKYARLKCLEVTALKLYMTPDERDKYSFKHEDSLLGHNLIIMVGTLTRYNEDWEVGADMVKQREKTRELNIKHFGKTAERSALVTIHGHIKGMTGREVETFKRRICELYDEVRYTDDVEKESEGDTTNQVAFKA